MKYPLPTLQETLTKYLRTVQPFLNDKELENSKKLITKFTEEGNSGTKLQKLLEAKAKNSENWLADWWLYAAYLSYRNPVVIWSNPGLNFTLNRFNSEEDRLDYTANIILGALEYKLRIDRYVYIY